MLFHIAFFCIDENGDADVDADGFQTVPLSKQQKWKQKKHIRHRLASKDVMSEKEIASLESSISAKNYNIARDLQLVNRCTLVTYLRYITSFNIFLQMAHI